MGSREQEIAELLENAADVIDTYGWLQGRSGNTNVGFCASGAMCQASVGFHPELVEKAWRVLNVAATKDLRSHDVHATGLHPAAVLLNDHPSTTQGDVTDLMRGVAKDLRNAA